MTWFQKKRQQSELLTDERVRFLNRAGLIVPMIVMVVGMSLAGVYATMARDQNTRDYQATLTQEAISDKSYIETSMKAYGQRIRSAATLFSILPEVSAKDWRTFYESGRSLDTLSGVQGTGFVGVYHKDAVPSEITTSTGGPLAVYPESNEELVAPIVYLEPQTPENIKAIGFDMYTNASRRQAMERARDTGMITMTEPVILVQDAGVKNPHPGVLVYYPIYKKGMPISSPGERRTALKGFVYIVTRPHDVMTKIDSLSSTTVVSDSQNHLLQLFYSPAAEDLKGAAEYHTEETAQVFDRQWTIRVTKQEAIDRRVMPWILFALGVVLSGIVAITVYRLFMRRVYELERVLGEEVQRSKDELLALASHQLRTPASGVKQYIGMLNSGFAGDLSPLQKELVQKAYDTNERQLDIINDLLYVSKLDAGQLVIEPRDMNMTDLVRKSIDDHDELASEKSVNISFRTKRPVLLTADARFVSMLVDNLISNAIKYSYPSSTVHVTLKSSTDAVELRVKDTGVGIDESDYERIFSKFTRVDNPLSHESGGSGLGLFLARQLARAHGGDITVVSQKGSGSIFTLILPKQLVINTAIVHLNPTRAKEDSPL